MIYTKINCMLPTYNRSQTKLPKFCESIEKTVSDKSRIYLSFCVNENDNETVEYLNNFSKRSEIKIDIIYENLPAPHLAKYFNLIYDTCKWKDEDMLVSMLGDDMEFQTQNWDSIILQNANHYNGICLLFCDDEKGTGDSLAVNFFTSRKYIDALKPLPFMCIDYPCDDMDVIHDQTARTLGRRIYLQNVTIFHNHATIPGNMDATWKRLRDQMPKVHEARKHAPEYIEKCLTNIRKNIPEEFTSEIDCIMTTYNRTELLEQTIDSYKLTGFEKENEAYQEWYQKHWDKKKLYEKKMPKLIVFDDCSPEKEKILSILNDSKIDYEFIDGGTNIGAIKKTPASLRYMFDVRKSKAVFIIDSDTLFYKYWWLKLNSIYRELKNDKDLGCISIFNSTSMYSGTVSDRFPGLLKKLSIGAFGTLITREYWEKYIVPMENDLKTNWDNRACRAAIKDGKNVYTTTPSFLQHIGILEGTHIGGEQPAVSIDFLEDKNKRKPSRFCYGNPNSNKVLFCLPGRIGDVIIGCAVANMLIEKGLKVVFYTLKMNTVIVDNLCPKVSIRTCPTENECSWWQTSTNILHHDFPDCKYIINAQPGSGEHHDNFIGSGMHMAWYIKQIAEVIIKDKLPDDFKKFWNYRPRKDVALNIKRYHPEKPLCIVSPHVVSIPTAITPEMVQHFIETYSKDFEVKILVAKKPEEIPRVRLHENYLYGYSLMDCFEIIRLCKLFIGNDSGMAWVSCLFDCDKIICHNRRRIVQTNCLYSKIDPKAKDVIN